MEILALLSLADRTSNQKRYKKKGKDLNNTSNQINLIETGFPGGPRGKNPLANTKDIRDVVQSLGREDLLEEGMATRCSIFAWRIP